MRDHVMTAGVRSRPLVASFVLFALALALPFATVAITATSWYVGSERERLRSTVTLIGEEVRDRIDSELAEMEAIARTLAASPSIDSGEFASFRAQALASIDPDQIAVVLAELDGRQLVNTRAPDDHALPSMPQPDVTEQMLRTRRPAISGLMTSQITGRPIVCVVAPVIRDGAVVRAVAVVIRAEHFAPLMRLPHVAGSYWAAVHDRNGRLVARFGEGAPLGEEPSLIQADRESQAATGEEGVLHIAQDFRHSDWRFVAGIGRAPLETPLFESLVLLLGSALILIGPGSLVALALARRIARTASGLTARAEAIGRGETLETEGSRIHEVQAVGNALAEASRAVADQRAALRTTQAGLEAEIEASRSLYRILAENVSDILILRRKERAGWIYASPSFERILGYDEAAQAALDVTSFIHPEDIAAALVAEAGLGPDRPYANCLFRARHGQGHWVWLETASTFITSAGPGEPDVISVMRDVTERQEQAGELRIARDMAELAKARAENASRAKSEFLAMVSHEIRTPLATIHGYTELLADSTPLSAEQTRHLALISEATGTMLTAVDDILDMARIEAGDFRIDEVCFAPAEASESVVAFARPIAAAHGIALGLTIDPNVPRLVRGDPRRLRQILLNLCHASLRERRGGLVTLSLYAPHPAEGRISFALTGSGGQGLGGSPAGEGLGLAIARRLVARMGGRLETARCSGEAVSFRFSLPFDAKIDLGAPADAPTEAWPAALPPPLNHTSSGPAPGALPGGSRLLLVEDHAINQEMTRRLLERLGHRVDVVEDGAAAVLAVQSVVYDLVLMDVQMAGMDGLAATRRIRALPHPARHVPIVALTAGVLPEQIRAIQEAGMNGHVGKPIDSGTLQAVIEAQLSSLMLTEPVAPLPAAAVMERDKLDRLSAELGADTTLGALRGFLSLLSVTFTDTRTLRAEAPALAVGARRLGLADLADALDGLTTSSGAMPDEALRRCHAARQLAERSLPEAFGSVPTTGAERVSTL